MIAQSELVTGEPKPSTWYNVSVVSTAADFARLRAEWDALREQSTAGVFNSWMWLYPWVRRIAPDRELFVLIARDEKNALVGALPLGIERRRVGGVEVRRLAFLGETHVGSDYLDVIARRGHEHELAAAFAKEILRRGNFWDVLELVDFDSASPTIKPLLDALNEAGLELRLSQRYLCPFEPLEQQTFDDFLKGTSRRDNFLRRKKWLEKQQGYELERASEPGKLSRGVSEFFKLHHMRWASDGGSQGIKGAGVEAFHRDATHLLAEAGKLRMYTMRIGEKPLASVYGIIDHGKFIYFQSGYDPEWRNKSVGLVLVGETFRDAHDAQLHEYDFLRGTESYKSDWTSQQRRTVAVRALNQTANARWFTTHEKVEKRVRETAKRLLPTDAVEGIRRLRRKMLAVK